MARQHVGEQVVFCIADSSVLLVRDHVCAGCAPSPGKTTVAGLYGRILRDLGLLSKGEVVVKVPADFIGSVLGESEKKTEAILEASKGCVLVRPA
jgi:hypothetical protein